MSPAPTPTWMSVPVRIIAVMGVGVNPWRILRERSYLRLVWWWFDGAPTAEWRGHQIFLDPRLDRVAKRCALMHELVHEERGVGYPDATAATMQREEEMVRRITADRLVPARALAEFVERCRTVAPVEARCVADEFDVTADVAVTAMQALARSEGVPL